MSGAIGRCRAVSGGVERCVVEVSRRCTISNLMYYLGMFLTSDVSIIK